MISAPHFIKTHTSKQKEINLKMKTCIGCQKLTKNKYYLSPVCRSCVNIYLDTWKMMLESCQSEIKNKFNQDQKLDNAFLTNLFVQYLKKQESCNGYTNNKNTICRFCKFIVLMENLAILPKINYSTDFSAISIFKNNNLVVDLVYEINKNLGYLKVLKPKIETEVKAVVPIKKEVVSNLTKPLGLKAGQQIKVNFPTDTFSIPHSLGQFNLIDQTLNLLWNRIFSNCYDQFVSDTIINKINNLSCHCMSS